MKCIHVCNFNGKTVRIVHRKYYLCSTFEMILCLDMNVCAVYLFSYRHLHRFSKEKTENNENINNDLEYKQRFNAV